MFDGYSLSNFLYRIGLRHEQRAIVIVPENHHVMISVEELDTLGCVVVYRALHRVYVNRNMITLWIPADEFAPPIVLNVSQFTVEYGSDSRSSWRGGWFNRRGFRLRFSFHEDATLPQRLSDGAWNCSVPHWPLFRPHVQCNLLTECAGGEDEAPCPYSSARCGPGRLSIGPSCYIYVAPAGPTSWQQASENCRSRGATLAVLKTLEEWTSVARVLHPGLSREERLLVGIQTASTRLPAM